MGNKVRHMEKVREVLDGEFKSIRQSRGAKGGGNKRSDFEKRINREQVLCQNWASLKERRHSAWGSISLGIPGVFDRREGFNLSWS